jgi:serpin B
MATRPVEYSYKNGFALALYERLRLEPGNLCFSPFSIRTALGMTYAGARGETAAEMGRALDLPPSDEALHALVGDLLGRLESSGGAAAMNVANALWSQEGLPLQTDFASLVSRHYGAPVNLVDFRRDAEAARGAINRWVENATRERIRELIPTGGVSSDTRLALVNAVFFKGSWALPFGEGNSHDARFHLEGGATVKARLMFQIKHVRYFEDRDLQAVELPYVGEDLLMVLALPRRENGLPDLEARLTAQSIDRWVDRMGREEVKLHVPRFKISWGTANISKALIAMGMAAAFDRVRADFSGINGRRSPDAEALFISSVFHQAFVEVDEEGTEAAAATAVVMDAVMSPRFRPPPPPIPVFRADHPFLFAIRHRSSGAILFLGRVSDPSRER